MAKLKTPKGKLVRKFGENIFGNPKFDRILNRKPYKAGQHGQTRRRRISNYGTQLMEKQKIKSYTVCWKNNSGIILKKQIKWLVKPVQI